MPMLSSPWPGRMHKGALLLLFTLFSAPAYAANSACEGDGVFYPIVNCITSAFRNAVILIMPEYQAIAEAMIGAVLTIAVMIAGFRLMFGNMGSRDILKLVLKSALLVHFVTHFGDYYDDIIGIMYSLAVVVTEPLNTSSIAQYCQQNASATSVTADMMVWARVDCLLGGLLGFGALSGGLFAGFGAILQGAVGSSFDSEAMGSIGPIFMILGIAMIAGLVFSLFRAAQMFICAYLGIGLLVLFAPFAFLCIVFKFTFTFFQKWLQMLIGFVVQPVLVLAFLTFMIVGMDEVLYESSDSVMSALTGGYTVCNVDYNQINTTSCVLPSMITNGQYSLLSGAVATGDAAMCDYRNIGALINQMRACGRVANCNVNLGFMITDDGLRARCMTIQSGAESPATQTDENNPQVMDQLQGWNWADPLCKSAIPPVVAPFMGSLQGVMSMGATFSCLNGVDPMPMLGAITTAFVLAYILYSLLTYIPDFASALAGAAADSSGSYKTNLANVNLPMEGAIQEGLKGAGGGLASGQKPEDMMRSFGQSLLSNWNTPRNG